MSKFKTLEREKIIVQAMRSKNVKSNLMVPPARVEEYYRQHRDLFSSKAQVKLRMIMIPGQVGASPSDDPQKAMAEEIRGKLITGADFDKMAQMYSEDSTRDLGGDWGWIDDKTLSAPLTEAAFKLKPGEISRVISLPGKDGRVVARPTLPGGRRRESRARNSFHWWSWAMCASAVVCRAWRKGRAPSVGS